MQMIVSHFLRCRGLSLMTTACLGIDAMLLRFHRSMAIALDCIIVAMLLCVFPALEKKSLIIGNTLPYLPQKTGQTPSNTSRRTMGNSHEKQHSPVSTCSTARERMYIFRKPLRYDVPTNLAQWGVLGGLGRSVISASCPSAKRCG